MFPGKGSSGWALLATTILRIGLVLFVIEFLIMLLLPNLAGGDGVEPWLATLGDSFLLSFIATPLILGWALLPVAPSAEGTFPGAFSKKWRVLPDLSFGLVVFKVGLAVFAVECGIMLLIPLTGLEEGSLPQALLDAGVVSLLASPTIFFLVVGEPGRALSSEVPQFKRVKRQFALYFLPAFILLTLVTEALHFMEVRSRWQWAEIEDQRELKLARDKLLSELDSVSTDLMLLADHQEIQSLIHGEEMAKVTLEKDFADFLRVKGRFRSLLFSDTWGTTMLFIDREKGGVDPEAQAPISPEILAKIVGLRAGEVYISGPSHGSASVAPSLTFATLVLDWQGYPRGVLLLQYPWEGIADYLRQVGESLKGDFSMFTLDRQPIFQEKMGGATGWLEPIWSLISSQTADSLEVGSGKLFFTTLHPNSQPSAILSPRDEEGHLHGFHAPIWKLLSHQPRMGLDSLQIEFRKRLVLFQFFLTGLVALGCWLLARSVVNRREAEARNERTHQSRITLSALLETSLAPLTMEEQLQAALNIVSTTPWLHASGKGAFFIVDRELGRMTLAAQIGLSDEARERGERVSLNGCLCSRSELQRESVLRFPHVDPRHMTCLEPKSRDEHLCLPIRTQDGTIGVMHLGLLHRFVHPVDEEDAFLSTVAGTLAGILERRSMEGILREKNEELKKTRLDLIHRLGMAAEYRDRDTGQHVVRMSKYAAALARAAGFSEGECENLLDASPMHDVGKIGIPDQILLKPGALNEEEWEIMKTHTLIGSYMLHGYEVEPMNTAHIIALTHHERWDGRGYPIGVPGEEIPIEGRICAIADVFDALTSDRPYKKAWSVEQAAEEIRRGAGTAFDPKLVVIFLNILPEILAIKGAYSDGE